MAENLNLPPFPLHVYPPLTEGIIPFASTHHLEAARQFIAATPPAVASLGQLARRILEPFADCTSHGLTPQLS
jgi:hypothetical protein